jgi:uncharacterized protein YlaI
MKTKQEILEEIKKLDLERDELRVILFKKAKYEKKCINHHICPDCGNILNIDKIKLPWYLKLLCFDFNQWITVYNCSNCKARFDKYNGNYYQKFMNATYRVTFDTNSNIVRTISYYHPIKIHLDF